MTCNPQNVEQTLTQNANQASGETLRVLVADDPEGITHALKLLLKSAGMEVLVAHSPKQVIGEVASGQQFDLLLMDMNYGRDTTSGQEGLELIEEIRKLDPQLQIVVMTAWSTVDIAVASLQHGAADFLQKPWDNDAALSMVGRYSSRTRENRARAARIYHANEDALQAQKALMGAARRVYGRFSLAGETKSAALVGGDYFDSFPISENEFAFCIADSMGKGTGAALAMANLQALVRAAGASGAAPANVCAHLNRTIFESRLQRLTTMFYAVVDTEHNVLRYTNAGHSPAFLLHKDGSVQRLHTEDALLGAIPEWNYHESSVTLQTGDRLIAVTDGLLELTDGEGREIGEEGLLQVVAGCLEETAPAMLAAVLGSIRQKDEVEDDTTALILAVGECPEADTPVASPDSSG